MTHTRFTRQCLHTVPSNFVRGMHELAQLRMFDNNLLTLMAWLHKCSDFYQRNIYNIVIKTMTYATGEWIREYEIMKRLIDIECVYTRDEPCLTVLDHVWFILKQHWSFSDRFKTYMHTCGVNFMYGCLYGIYGLIRSHAFSHGLVRPLIRSYTAITSVPGF